MPQGSQGHILDLCETLLAIEPEAVPSFLKSLSDVLSRITVNQLETWFQHGVGLLKDNPESGIAFFKVESNTSESMLETLSSSLELERIKGIIRLYCRALSGAPVDILNTNELVRKNIGWVDEDMASTDGTKVFLPSVVDHYTSKQDNFSWFKVVSTHQVAHLEFSSFEYDFEKPPTQFIDRRFDMEKEVTERRAIREQAMANQRALLEKELAEQQANQVPEFVQDYEGGLEAPAQGVVQSLDQEAEEVESVGPGRALTDIGRFLHLFDNRQLAFDIFTVLEDCRLDFRIVVEYPGIRTAASRVQKESLATRPKFQELGLQEALVELLVHMSLEQFHDLPVPKEYEEAAVMLARILHQLRTVQATVEDTGEATLRAYEIISRIQNETQPEDQWEEQDLEEPGDFSEEEFESLLEQLQANLDAAGEPGEGEPYDSPEPVDFRGDFKPEMVQLLTKLQMDQDQQGDGEPISQEMLEQLLQESAELELDAEQGDIDANMTKFAQNIMKEAGTPPPNAKPGQGYGPLQHNEDQGGELEPREPQTYVYDEWDFRAADYRPRWCIVKEKNVDEGDPSFYNDALKNYLTLSTHIKRQFELIMPESFKKIYRLIDGEDIDLNAALEAWADLKMKVPPDEKIYWHRNRARRDVAVVFLLDMSASTAEAIDEGRRLWMTGMRPTTRWSTWSGCGAAGKGWCAATTSASSTWKKKAPPC